MDEVDRRRAERRSVSFPVRLSVEQPAVLQGQTVNLSASGVLVTADGKIPVIVEINGVRYAGHLVRAMTIAGESTAYAIQVTETLDPCGPFAA